ncbi:Long chain acyl-CoA synthetase 7 [Escovopsis weberi]|uniref:Long chain acyl-CoA synthetase 7 n=1 Tax=Escovopsis weberi TaxID=150374 RepID=A0A0M8N2Z8_ESCWE|nr:Long chain acyl-CoA synthetase 7 [Escovopsis weberi]
MTSPSDATASIRELPKVPYGQPQGVPVPGSERPNRSAVYRHWKFRDIPLLTTLDPEVQTIHDLFEASAQTFPENRCFGTRHWNPLAGTWTDQYEWETFAEIAERRKNFGAGIVEIHRDVGISREKFGVGLWSQNRAEWQIADLGFASQALHDVPLYETLGPDTSEYIINHAELACVVCSLHHLPVLLKIAPRVPGLKLIVSLDPLDQGEQEVLTKSAILGQIAAQHGIKLYSMTDVEKIGAASGRPMRAPVRDDICTISYTSGTTGLPKGVILSHENAVSAIIAGRLAAELSSKDVHISYLPLAHIYGRVVDQIVWSAGARTGFFRGDILGLVDDLKILKPTRFTGVPRVYNRFKSAISTATVDAQGIRGVLSRQVIAAKKTSMKLPGGKATNKHLLYDRIWTPKVKAAIGLDRVHSMVSGGALLDPDVHEFLRAAFGNNFVQGYGLTETYATGTVQLLEDLSIANAGPPTPATEICLESVPEFDYTVEDKPHPRGEILMRGPHIFKGYFKNEEETNKALDPDGWFHTGDIGEIDGLGRIKIIDRKKNVLKLSQGEYISPERIENVYLGNTNLVNMAYVHGDPTESTLVAIFAIDLENFPAWASKILGETLTADNLPTLKAAANSPKVVAEFLKVLDKIARNAKFNSFERVRNVYLDIEPFSMKNDLITPSMKLKRAPTAKIFRAQIDRMYEEINAQAPASSKL